MLFKEPKAEYVEIILEDVITTSPGQSYDVCQKKGISGMDQDKFCLEMGISGMDLSSVSDF